MLMKMNGIVQMENGKIDYVRYFHIVYRPAARGSMGSGRDTL